MPLSPTDIEARLASHVIGQLADRSYPVWSRTATRQPGSTALPINHATQRPYTGINVLLLWASAQERGITQHHWLAPEDAAPNGVRLKPDAQGVSVLHNAIAREASGNSVLATRTVFPVSDFETEKGEAIEAPSPGSSSASTEELDFRDNVVMLSLAGRSIRQSGLKLYQGSLYPTYVPKGDMIWMPHGPSLLFTKNGELIWTPFDDGDVQFDVGFAGDLARQFASATGHPSRLGRYGKHRIRSDANDCPSNNLEELIVELAAIFLCAHLGVAIRHRHHPWTERWLEGLRTDPKFLTRAAGEASRAARLMAGDTKPKPATKLTTRTEPLAAVA